VQSEVGQGTTVVLTLPAHPVSGVSQGNMNLDADVLVALDTDISGHVADYRRKRDLVLKRLGGTFEIRSEAGKGTHLAVIIPIDRKMT